MNRKIFIFIIISILLWAGISWTDDGIKSKEVDLGEIIQGKPLDYTFHLKNPGSKALRIKKITPD